MKATQKLIINQIVKKFSNLNGTSFVGIREYKSKSTGEIANHIINANFSYGNAVDKDIKALENATEQDILNISKKGMFTIELVNTAIDKLKNSFINNKNTDTQSAQSIGQQNAFINITNSIKYCIESGEIHIYALGISKEVLVNGEHKIVNSRELTMCQNAVKKYFNFSTSKYRSFIINPDNLTSVKVKGETYTIA